jgi:hypothetical protein
MLDTCSGVLLHSCCNLQLVTISLPCVLLLQVHRMGWVPTAKGDSSDGEEQAQVSCWECVRCL